MLITLHETDLISQILASQSLLKALRAGRRARYGAKAIPKSTKWTQKCSNIYPDDRKMRPNGVTRIPKTTPGRQKRHPEPPKPILPWLRAVFYIKASLFGVKGAFLSMI